MTWQTGTTNNYLTALQALIDVATSDHVATVAINAAGTGYVVGDVLTVAGGTSTYAATLLVTSVGGGGQVTGVRIQNGGAYTADPTLTGNSATGGTGSSATFNLTMSGTGWTIDRREYRAARATVSAGGTGYTLNDVLTVSGGTSVEAAKFKVASVSGGVVTSVSPVDPTVTTTDVDVSGRYTATPSNPASTTGGTGSGCTLTIEYEQELIMEGSGTGSQDITVGIRTYQTTDISGFNTTYNWALFAFGSFNSGLEFFAQPNISPGFSSTPAIQPLLNTEVGAFVPLRDTNGSFPITFWFNITPSRIICVFKVEGPTTTIYPSMHLGYLNQLGTTTELPYPMYVAGAAHRRNVYYADTTPFVTGLTSMDGGGADAGPGFVYRPGSGSWAGVDNSDVAETGNSRTVSSDSCVYPGGDPNLGLVASGFQDIVIDGWSAWNGAIPDSGVPGTAAWQVYPTPDTGGDIYWLVPATVIDSDDNSSNFLAYGEIDDVFWVGRGGVLTSEDTITVDGEVYRVFQNGNRTEEWSYMAVKESF